MLHTLPLILVAAAPWLQEPDPAEPRPLEIGESLEGRLTAGSGGVLLYEFTPASSGPLTISFESFEFDPTLELRGAALESLATDDDGGVERNARLVVELEAGRPYLIEARSKEARPGSFRLWVRAGAVPPPSGDELDDLLAGFYRVYAERHLTRAADSSTGASTGASTGSSTEAARKERAGALQYLVAAANLDHRWQRTARERDSAERARDLARELGDEPSELMARVLLAGIAGREGSARRATVLLEDLLPRLAGAALDDWRALALDHLAEAHLDLGELDHAEQRAGELADLARARENEGQEAVAWTHLGRVDMARGDRARARTWLELAATSCRRRGDPLPLARALLRLGELQQRHGELELARETLGQALAAARAGGDDGLQASLLGRAGNVAFERGELDRALELYVQAGELAAERSLATLELDSFLGRARVLYRLGEAAELSDLLERRLGDPVGEPAPDDRARLLNLLGLARHELGDPAGSRRAHEQALEAAREGTDPLLEFSLACDFGAVRFLRGELTEAEPLYRKALEAADAAGSPLARSVALSNLAELFTARGSDGEARRLAEEGLRLAREVGYARLEPSLLASLARCALRRGDLAVVETHLSRTLELLEAPTSGPGQAVAAARERSQSAVWSGIVQDWTAARVAAEPDEGRRAELVARGFEEVGRWKARRLLEGIAEHRHGGSETAGLRREWRRALLDREAVLQRLEVARSEPEGAAELERLRAEGEALLALAREREQAYRAAAPHQAALDRPLGARPEELQRRVLGEGDLLLDFVAGEQRLYVYAVTRRGTEFLDLGSLAELERLLTPYLGRLAAPEGTGDLALFADYGPRLFELLVAPALARLGHTPRRLIVVPDGQLAALPFEALVVRAPADTTGAGYDDLDFLIDGWSLAYAPSSPALLELGTATERERPGRALVLADPHYAAELSSPTALASRSTRVSSLRALPGTRLEAETLAELVGASSGQPPRSGVLHLSGVDLHFGPEASVERLQSDLGAYSVLHLATHGLVDAGDPRRTGVALAWSADGGGFLSLLDVLELDLDAELTVLSACETARGRMLHGEGVQSLARAFLFAGSRSVVASLWKVADREATLTMQGFYRRLLEEGLPAHEALRRAKLALRRGALEEGGASPERGISALAPRGVTRTEVPTGHPFHWAPFVYVGPVR